MQSERNECGTMDEALDADLTGGLNRRRLIGAAVSSFVVGANGLLLPAGVEDAAARGHRPPHRLQERTGHHRRKQHSKRAQNRRQRRSRGREEQTQDPASGVCIKVMDMTLIFSIGFARDHLMSVAEGDPDCNHPMKFRWIDQVVPGNHEFQFVGWYPEMHLDLYSVSPNLHFEARNPRAGYPRMNLTKDDPSAPGGRRTVLDQGFFEYETVHVEGVLIKRQEDIDEHKVFLISPDYP